MSNCEEAVRRILDLAAAYRLAEHPQAALTELESAIRTALTAKPAGGGEAAPIDMVLHCPACGKQHIDAREYQHGDHTAQNELAAWDWDNPPHRSHLCHGCGHIWRPADVPTNGVQAVKTRGKNDSEVRALGVVGGAGEVPAGWKLVPVEATKEMADAADSVIPRLVESDVDPYRVYRAMLNAAPPAPGSTTPDAVAEPTACNPHPDAPHGFNRNASHNAGRYVCDCEGWTP